MKKGVTIIAFLFCFSALFAQKLSEDFEVTKSTPYPVIDAGSKEYISLDNGFALMAKMGRGAVNIQKFDVKSMKEVKRNTYEDLPKSAVFQDIIKLGDKVFYIYEAYNKKAKNFTVYSREIDTESVKFLDQKALFSTSRKVVGSPRNGDLREIKAGMNPFSFHGTKFLVYKSYDESKVMISYRLVPADKNDKVNHDVIGFFIFDNAMKMIGGKEVKMPYTEEQMNNIGYAVSSNGDAVMIAANREESMYELFLVNPEGELTVKKLDVSTDLWMKNVIVREAKNGDIILGGFYANGLEFKFNPFSGGTFTFNANGLVYVRIDKSGNVVHEESFDFSEDFIMQNLNSRLKKHVREREKEGKAGIFDLFLNDVIVKEDGSVYFVGERQWARNELWGPQQKTVYHFGNVVVMKVNKEGKLEWMKKLPKNQAGIAGCGQMSIAYMQGKTADYIAYVDNPKNIGLDAEDGIPEAHKDGLGGFLTTYKIDHRTGALEKHTICDLKDIDGITAYQFKTWRIFNAGEGVFLMEVYIKGKKDSMVKFQLK